MKRTDRIRSKIRGMTPRELAGEASQRARRRISRAISRATTNPETSYISDVELRRSLGRNSIVDVAARIRTDSSFCLLPGLRDLNTTVTAVKELFPKSIGESRVEAEAILEHRFPLFESILDFGPQIDWHADPRTGVRWPLAHFTRMPLVIGHGADVRVVWELNRLHHLVSLGRAYLLIDDERFAEEFLVHLASWYEDNPPNFGVNWTVAMEAGIRAVNIIAALEMFRRSLNITDQAIELILKLLLSHGRYIRANLEYSYRTASNHYLSNLIGLMAIGTAIPELKEARLWREFSTKRLVKEMDQQVLSDGVDYEVSTGYHRFVLEIFSLFFSLTKMLELDPGAAFRERQKAMFEFVRSYLKPDRTAPLLGDSDDGRLIRFKERTAVDHSYLLSIGAVLTQQGEFKQSKVIDEEAIWWFGRSGVDTFENLPIDSSEPGSRAFPEAQIFMQRAGNSYSLIDCGDHGLRGHGSHAHSDALSIEIFGAGRTLLRDPGTYVYTASEQDRNLFRSTSYHNTVRVDGEEISQVNQGELFAFASNVRPRVNLWQSTAERDVLDAEHYAYRCLAAPVTHRRVITFDKRQGCWTIRDVFTGNGTHTFEFFFNFDAGLEVSIQKNNHGSARDNKCILTIAPTCDHPLESKIEQRWISTAYGTRLNSSAIIYSLEAKVPLDVNFQLVVST